MSKIKKGYAVNKASNDIIRCAIISIVIIGFMWRLAQYKGLPNMLLWIAVIVLIYGYITSKTTIGRHLYAIGGNEKLHSFPVSIQTRYTSSLTQTWVFLAAVAGMVTIARLNSANPTAGDSYEMDAITACVVGGVSMTGGVGKRGALSSAVCSSPLLQTVWTLWAYRPTGRRSSRALSLW